MSGVPASIQNDTNCTLQAKISREASYLPFYAQIEVKDVMPSRYVGVYFAGSNGLVTENHWFQTLAEQILNNNGVVAGSGDAEEAVQNLRLTNYIDSGYSLPESYAGRPDSEYGSAAAEAVRLEAGWMIHKNQLLSSDTDDITKLGERVVRLLAS